MYSVNDEVLRKLVWSIVTDECSNALKIDRIIELFDNQSINKSGKKVTA